MNPSLFGASGELISTTRDLNRFFAALLGGRLLPPRLLHEMKQPGVEGGTYGLGLSWHKTACGVEVYGNDGDAMTLDHVTIAGNTATDRGVGGMNLPPTGVFSVGSTIVAGNTPTNCGGAQATSAGYNLENGHDCRFDAHDVNAGLETTLSDQGGETDVLRILKDSPARGWARMKTGTLGNTIALAGYVNDAQGRPWAVAMMINHERAHQARPALDALVEAGNSEDVKTQLARNGAQPLSITLDQFGTFIADDIAKWRKVVDFAQIKG